MVRPGALAARAGAVDTASGQVADVASAVHGIDAGAMPPKTGAALEAALAAWPAAVGRLARALDATAGALRSADSAYDDTDGAVRSAARGQP